MAFIPLDKERIDRWEIRFNRWFKSN